MATFVDQEAAQRARDRIGQLAHAELGDKFWLLFDENPSPDLALTNLERWLQATTSPWLQLQQVQAAPVIGKLLVTLMGASQPLADALIQNPELASLLFDPSERNRRPEPPLLLAEGRRLLSAADSYSHRLDRLRYLKQRWTLPIAVNDLCGEWAPEVVWRAISDLADALVTLALEVVWGEYAREKGLDAPCPLMVVGFGKLGGHELNYSSDIDLAYVLADDADEALEKHAIRACERLGRALEDRMGRGALYRVDLRLRPYGGAGAIVRRMNSYEGYYRLYAEAWEVQALLRSRPLCGVESLGARWNTMREERCFRPALSEIALEEMIAMRLRIEAGAEPDDLKRGAGGIRDVEFLVQALQLMNGYAHPGARALPTPDAIRGLRDAGILEFPVAEALEDGYRLLRQLEHRIQLVGDRQTHTLPASPEARSRIARSLGIASPQELMRLLEGHRRTIHTLYSSRMTPAAESAVRSDRDAVADELGELAESALPWFDAFEESTAFYASLRANEGSLGRVRAILANAPILVSHFRGSVALTELLMSGEIEEESNPERRVERLPLDAAPKAVAEAYRNALTALAARWTLEPGFNLCERLCRLAELLVDHVARRLQADFSIIALGSFGSGEMTFGSDADCLLLVREKGRQADAEGQAQGMLSFMSQLKRLGVPMEVDLRLRPEGGKGLLVRTYEGFAQYELDSMEMWERFALGAARLVHGEPEALEHARRAAFAMPLTPERLRELLAMKKRIETERVPPQYVRRDVKLGHGGLSDIEWLVHLVEMRYPTATQSATWRPMEDRIRAMARAHLINAVEAEELLEARAHLLTVRNRLGLMGIGRDIVPENPDKLARLATASGFGDGNAFLSQHEHVIDRVRAMFQESMERLRA